MCMMYHHTYTNTPEGFPQFSPTAEDETQRILFQQKEEEALTHLEPSNCFKRYSSVHYYHNEKYKHIFTIKKNPPIISVYHSYIGIRDDHYRNLSV